MLLAMTFFIAACQGPQPERPGAVDRQTSAAVSAETRSCLASRGYEDSQLTIEVDRARGLISYSFKLKGTNALDSLNECLDQAGVVTLEAHP